MVFLYTPTPGSRCLFETWKGLLKTHRNGWETTPKEWSSVSQDAIHALKQRPLYGGVSPIAEYVVQKSGGGSGVALSLLHLITHSQNFELCWFKGLSSQTENVSPSEHNSCIDLADETVTWSFGTLCFTEPRGPRITQLAGVIDPNPGEFGLFLPTGSSENYFWNPGDFLGTI